MKKSIVHISDIHFRQNQPEGVSTVLKALIEDLKTQMKSISSEFILAISGDIIAAGTDSSSYTSFISEFSSLLDDIGLTKENRIVVPGNHDVDRESLLDGLENNKEDYQSYSKKEVKFNDYFCSKNDDIKFDNYILFESEFAKYGIGYNCGGKGMNIEPNLGVYCLNSAIGSFGGLNNIADEKQLAIYTRELVEWCNSISTKMNIIVMHHPISFLNKWSAQKIRTILEDNFALCLSGHNHHQDIFYTHISNKTLVCSAPALFTTKYEQLGYSIILVEDYEVNRIIYRQYSNGKFFNGSSFSRNNSGVIYVNSDYLENKEKLEKRLDSSLAYLKNQPHVFIEPKLSKTRKFNEEDNELNTLLKKPYSVLIVAQPQFGITCLSNYLRLEYYKKGSYWVHINCRHVKARELDSYINEQILEYKTEKKDIGGFIIDSWDSGIIDHKNILKQIDKEYYQSPIIVLSNYAETNFIPNFDFSKLKTKFEQLHLQALERRRVRELIKKYNSIKNIGDEDSIVNKVDKELQALNIHRTPLNILTLLKVFEKSMHDDILNRTKMISAVLFLLFTDSETFKYSSSKPNVEDTEYVLGRYCSELMMSGGS